jgi:hypothetical protein
VSSREMFALGSKRKEEKKNKCLLCYPLDCIVCLAFLFSNGKFIYQVVDN